MKNLMLIIIACVVLQLTSTAQVAINTDAAQPDGSAMLDIKSTTKGLLPPRVNGSQMLAITSPADGLVIYNTDVKGLYVYGAGIGWQPLLSSGGFTLPYSATINSASTLFSLSNTGTGQGISSVSTGGDGIYGNTSTLNGAGLLADNLDGGEAAVGRTVSVSGTPTGAVVGRNDGPGYGVYGFLATDNSGLGIGVLGQVGINGSTGIAGHFENLNSANGATTLEAVTNGTGSGATITNTNNANVSNILYVTSNGPGVIADHTQGNAADFLINNTNGVGAGVRGETNSIFGNNGTAGVYGSASGTGGYGGYFDHTNSTGFGLALEAVSEGLGVCTHIENLNAANTQTALEAVTDGTGSGATITNTNTDNVSNTLYVTSNGPGVIADHTQGNAADFFINNTNGVGAGVRGETNSIFGNNGTAGVYGSASGTGGYGGYFDHTNSTGFGIALYATSAGFGVCTHIESTNAANTQTALEAVTDGTGSGATITNTNTDNVSNILYVTSNGPGVIADHSQGNAGSFFMNNTNGVGAGVRGEVNSIFGNAGTAGVYGVASGSGGYAGYFQHSNTSGFGVAVYAEDDAQGDVLVCNQAGTSGDLAVFQTGGADVARIDRTGKGYFDGGTTNSGADLAEAVDVEGNFNQYEPGDVLEISASSDRTVVKCSSPYSTLVVGVYATKPGVLLTEDSLNSTSTGKVPMGVVGIIPTKVCNENGAIARGDLLVTSSRPGYAMKADVNKVKIGQVLGKAMQSFDGETGKIKVLVNVR